MSERIKDPKLKARRSLAGRYLTAAGAVAMAWVISALLVIMAQICVVFSGILSFSAGKGGQAVVVVFGFCVLAFFLFQFLLVPGMVRLYLNICRGRKTGVEEIFWGFHNHVGKFLGLGLLAMILAAMLMTPEAVLSIAARITGDWRFARIFLPCYNLLLTVAGIYVNLTYGQFYMILADDPEKPILQAFAESREMTQGSRLKLLAFWLSFLGWVPVVFLTLGVSLLWLIPYFACAQGFFYLEIKARWSEEQE